MPWPCFNATAVGPTPNFPEPRYLSVAVGTRKAGPAPQVSPFFVWEGEKNALIVASPKPDCEVFSPVRLYWVTSGKIHRVIRFKLSLNLIGITGWKFITFCVPLLAPIPYSVLFWNGTLIRLAMGLANFFASSAASFAVGGGCPFKSVVSWARTKAGKLKKENKTKLSRFLVVVDFFISKGLKNWTWENKMSSHELRNCLFYCQTWPIRFSFLCIKIIDNEGFGLFFAVSNG